MFGDIMAYAEKCKQYAWTGEDTRMLQALLRKQAFWDIEAHLEGGDAERVTGDQVERILDRYMMRYDSEYYRMDEWDDMHDAIAGVLDEDR